MSSRSGALPDRPTTSMAGVLEQRGDALAEQRVVFADDDPQRLDRFVSGHVSGGCSVACGHDSLRGESRSGCPATPAAERRASPSPRILAETERPVEVYEAALEAIGRPLRWQLGAVWELDPSWGSCGASGAGTRASAPTTSRRSARLSPWRRAKDCRGGYSRRATTGWSTRPEDANFPRAGAAAASGLHAGFGFPLRSPRGILGVMEFFSGEPRGRTSGCSRRCGSWAARSASSWRAAVRKRRSRASESRLRAMLDSALDAVVTMDASRPRHRLEPRGRGDLRVPGRRGDGPGDGGADRSRRPSRRASARAGAVPRDRGGRGPRPPARVHGHAARRHRVPGRADDHADPAARPTDLHRIPEGHHRPRTGRGRSCAPRARGLSRSATPSAADPAQPSRWSAAAADGGVADAGSRCAPRRRSRTFLERAIEELAAGLEEIRELASGLHPSVLTERGLGAALEALALRTPCPSSSMSCRTAGCPSRWRRAAYYVVAEALANVHKHAGRTGSWSGHDRRTPCRGVVVDDGVGGADADGAGLRGLADRVEALGGRLCSTPRRAAGRGFPPSFRTPGGRLRPALRTGRVEPGCDQRASAPGRRAGLSQATSAPCP